MYILVIMIDDYSVISMIFILAVDPTPNNSMLIDEEKGKNQFDIKGI